MMYLLHTFVTHNACDFSFPFSRITVEDQQLLIADMVSGMSHSSGSSSDSSSNGSGGNVSRAETAYEMLYALPVYECQALDEEGIDTVAAECMNDLGAQFEIILKDLRKK